MKASGIWILPLRVARVSHVTQIAVNFSGLSASAVHQGLEPVVDLMRTLSNPPWEVKRLLDAR
jgi:hypothetical protein